MPDPVPNTDNHNLPKIPPLDSQYSDEWGFILNDGEFADGSDAGSDALVQALEERVTIVDDEANLGLYTPYDNAAFRGADTGRVFLGDGTNWVAQSFGTAADPVPGTSHFESVSAGEHFTEIAGARLTKDSSQTVSDNTLTEITWGSATEKNANADPFADVSNNSITIPNGQYSYARLSIGLRTGSPVEWDLLIPSLNGSISVTAGGRFEPKTTWQATVFITDWISVSSGDSFSIEFRHTGGSDIQIDSSDERVFFALEAV